MDKGCPSFHAVYACTGGKRNGLTSPAWAASSLAGVATEGAVAGFAGAMSFIARRFPMSL